MNENFLVIEWNFLKNWVEFSENSNEILIKIAWNSLKNSVRIASQKLVRVKFFWMLPEFFFNILILSKKFTYSSLKNCMKFSLRLRESFLKIECHSAILLKVKKNFP